MLRYLFDTDHLTLYDHAHVAVWRHFSSHPWDTVGISPVTIEEYLRGRLAVLTRHPSGPLRMQAYSHLVGSLEVFAQFAIVPFDLACEAQFQQLRRLRLRVGSQDLRIASIALIHQLILVTRNRRDFAPIPGLVLEDWSI